MKPLKKHVENIYTLIANEEDARICTDIDDAACRETPGNFMLIMLSLFLTKIGDFLMSPKIVLAWLLSAIGAPGAIIAWLVPIRESGSMIPQLAIGAWIRQHPHRRGFWILGSVLQSACVTSIAFAVWTLDGFKAGLAVLLLLALFSLSRGICSVAMKDIQGKCIPKSRRGRLAGLATTLSGVVTVLLSLSLFGSSSDPNRLFYTILLLTAAALWAIAAILFRFIKEFKGETAGGGNGLKTALQSLKLLKEDRPFRHFVTTRALLMGSALSAPFIVMLAQSRETDIKQLGVLLLASSLASSVSASFWGWMADKSSKQVMTLGGAIASATCLLAGLAAWFAADFPGFSWGLPIAYFILTIAHSGVRIGRKTYIIDMAGGVKRSDYVAVSNTVIGLLLLVTGGISALASLISIPAVLILLGLLGAAGTILTIRLKSV